MDSSLPISSVHRFLQERILEWVPFPSPGNLPNQGVELGSPVLQANSLLSEQPGTSQTPWSLEVSMGHLVFVLYR